MRNQGLIHRIPSSLTANKVGLFTFLAHVGYQSPMTWIFNEHFESALSYTWEPFSNALALHPYYTSKRLSNAVIKRTGDATNLPPHLEKGIKIISETLDPNTSQPMVGSDNEEREELQFDLDYY
jgi:hypothetical protein